MQTLTPQQKLGIGVFIIVGSATIVFGMFRIRNTIASAFRQPDGASFTTEEQREAERTRKLKAEDTDGDTLTDYDELYVYRTSPFLPDTDSDTIDDGAEVKAATDPNCPKGTQCRAPRPSGDSQGGLIAASAPAPSTASAPTAAAPTQADAIAQAILATFGDVTALSPAELEAKVNAMPLAELRTFLVTIGIPEDAVRKADEATLRALVVEAFSESAAAAKKEPATRQP